MRGGRLQEVPNIVICLGNFWYFGKLVAEERDVVATGASTVLTFQQHTQLSPSTQLPSNTASVGNNILQGRYMGRCAGCCRESGSL